MQTSFKFDDSQLLQEVSSWAYSEKEKGQVYTCPEVVDFMINSIGIADDIDNVRILEPSCGEGKFVVAITNILINQNANKPPVSYLMGKILAVDLVSSSVNIAKAKVEKILELRGYTKTDSKKIIENWFLSTDFLLAEIESNFTHVIGNPPYVRIENVPKQLLAEYRRRYSTMTGRADLYIPFFEKSLSLLVDDGRLSFLCTDRWTKNIYGRSLRKLISEKYSLELFVDLYGMDVFDQKVMTYPAITQISKSKKEHTVLVNGTTLSHKTASEVISSIQGHKSSLNIRKNIVKGDKPWLLGASDQISLIQRLENEFPSLEEAGCRVFIGAATGSNKVYIVNSDNIDIEKSRLLPVITASEIKSGNVKWKNRYIINTYDENGIINLDKYPKLSKYLHGFKDILSQRHVAKKDRINWFKTIDRVYSCRASSEKLLIPDISNTPVVIYDKGKYHPNNSIYYICSEEWNLEALRVILLSNITRLFISAYSTKIANGYIRYQAQHLRKLRLPSWSSIDKDLKDRIISAGKDNNIEYYTSLTYEVYKLSEKEKMLLENKWD